MFKLRCGESCGLNVTRLLCKADHLSAKHNMTVISQVLFGTWLEGLETRPCSQRLMCSAQGTVPEGQIRKSGGQGSLGSCESWGDKALLSALTWGNFVF
jgi:hypothetical protein